MSGTTNFQQFNPAQTNSESDAAYTAEALRSGGIPTGSILPGVTANKLFYQTTTFVAAFGQMMANKGISVSDANFSNLVAALSAIVTSADQSGSIVTVAYGSTVTFAAGTAPAFDLTLTGNVSSAYLTGPVAGQRLLFIVAQDSVGGRSFVWPSNVSSPGTICLQPSSVSVQSFVVRPSGAIVPSSPMYWITSAGAMQPPNFGAVSVSATGTISNAYAEILEKVDATSGAITRTLFSAVGMLGFKVNVKKVDSGGNSVTIATQTGQFIDGSYLNYAITRQYDSLTLVSDGTGWAIV